MTTQISFTSAITIEASRQPTRIVIVIIQLRGTSRGYPAGSLRRGHGS
jgi:hypothetical protein